MLPQADPLQPEPLRLQVTAVLELLVTVAMNCCCFPATTFAEVGETLTATGNTIVTVAEPDLVGSARETAWTVTWEELGRFAGAVYKPVDVIVPQSELEQDEPLSFQVTPVMVVPETKATNCCCRPIRIFAVDGETLTATSEDVPTMTAALADAERSANDVAVTVTTLGAGAVAGAK